MQLSSALVSINSLLCRQSDADRFHATKVKRVYSGIHFSINFYAIILNCKNVLHYSIQQVKIWGLSPIGITAAP